MAKTKRQKAKYPGLKKNLNVKVRQELIDHDYIDKLNDEEKAWLSKFNEEYVSASFKKTKGGKFSPKNLHKTKKLRKDCYDRNNWRNNDVLGVTKANGMLKEEESAQAILEDRSVRSAGLSRGYNYFLD
jgi:hypothetical protein